LKREIHALGVSAKLQKKFLDFAVYEGGASERKFPPRLHHVIKGRTPSAYIALLIAKFFNERRYEDFTRTTKDHVEYITSDGNTAELEELVAHHPLALRITRVRMTNWVFTGKPNAINLYLRSPIPKLQESEINENTTSDPFNERLLEFGVWLATQGDVPISHQRESGDRIEVLYSPDWLRFADEEGFEFYSELGGSVDISHGIDLLIYSHLGANSPDIPPGLDTFDNLSSLFDGTEASRAPAELSFSNYWPRIVAGRSAFAEIFFARLNQFPPKVRSQLEPFFKAFAGHQRGWVKKALEDRKLYDENVGYVATPRDVAHYNRVKEVFFDELKPVLESCWELFCATALEILAKERVRAREQYEKMRKHFQ
jgi:hypothetical protein